MLMMTKNRPGLDVSRGRNNLTSCVDVAVTTNQSHRRPARCDNRSCSTAYETHTHSMGVNHGVGEESP